MSSKRRGMTHEEVVEILVGFAYGSKIAPRAIPTKLLPFPYDRAVQMLQSGARLDAIRAECGSTAVDVPSMACKNVAFEETNWLALLERKYFEAEAARELRAAAEKLEKGQPIDEKHVQSALFNLHENHQRPIPLSAIKDDGIAFVPTGYAAFDQQMGGFPQQGLLLVAGAPKSGKTSLAITFAKWFAIKKRSVVIYSMEMTNKQMYRRALQVDIPRRVLSYVSVKEDLYSMTDIAGNLAREQHVRASKGEPSVELAIMDFADMMVEDEVSESVMGKIYKDASKAAKVEAIPLMLLAQLNANYVGDIPRPNYIRYTRLAEAMGTGVMTTYNPATDFTGQQKSTMLPHVRGRAYLCVWAWREGFLKHERDAPGAIPLAWDGKTAWGDSLAPHWIPLH